MEIKDHMSVVYARRLAHDVARYLKKRYGATKVLLIGSLTVGVYNPDFSDIDVCFIGVREELVASAVADCRLHFGERDSGGRKRLDCMSSAIFPREAQQQIFRESEEI